MADIVNTGTAADTGTGDELRTAFTLINDRFQQLLGTLSQITWATGLAIQATPARQWTVVAGQAYVATSNHIAGATFAADLAAGKWLAVDVAQLQSDLSALEVDVAQLQSDLELGQVTPAFHAYGGQLRRLREKLADPLVQFLGIVFVGDSITWGRTLPDNAVFDPRDGTLSDPRDSFSTASFVNEFKRYVGSQYARGGTPVLSNWAASTSGQAIAEYTATNVLYPRELPFLYTSSGASISVSEVAATGLVCGYQFRLADGNPAGTSWHKISFPFTGTEFTLVFASLEADHCDYELIVDGVSQGIFTTGPGGSIVEGNNQRRTHTFGFVKNKTIEIKTNRVAYASGVRALRLEGIEVARKIRITNQGINGATTLSYQTYNLSGGFGDGVAVGASDSFVILQLGTNDRGANKAFPGGVQGFRRNLSTILTTLTGLGEVVVMAGPPAVSEAAPTYTFTMQDCRNTLLAECKVRSLDLIDNFAAFNGATLSDVLADGLHPNEKGMRRIAANIIGALEQA